jgi:hypothetical protein
VVGRGGRERGRVGGRDEPEFGKRGAGDRIIEGRGGCGTGQRRQGNEGQQKKAQGDGAARAGVDAGGARGEGFVELSALGLDGLLAQAIRLGLKPPLRGECGRQEQREQQGGVTKEADERSHAGRRAGIGQS